MSTEKSCQPDPLKSVMVLDFLKRIQSSGAPNPQHMIVGQDGVPIYSASIPFMLITGGTILDHPSTDQELRIVAFEELDCGEMVVGDLPTIVRVVVRGSDDDRLFLGKS